MKNKTERIVILLTKEQAAKLEALAGEIMLKPAQFARIAILQALKKGKTKGDL